MNSPLILLCMDNGNEDMDYFGRILNDLAGRSRIPAATVYDHTSSFDSAIRGIRAGFNTIMVGPFPGLPYEENAGPGQRSGKNRPCGRH